MPEDYPVSIAEQMMAKVEDLKQVIIGSQAFVIPVIRKSTKVKSSTNPKGYRCLRMRIAAPLENFLKGVI